MRREARGRSWGPGKGCNPLIKTERERRRPRGSAGHRTSPSTFLVRMQRGCWWGGGQTGAAGPAAVTGVAAASASSLASQVGISSGSQIASSKPESKS